MANPAVSNNTPVAGSITWTSFGIAYNGGNYTVPAGSTANRFVWWKFNAGAPALQQGNSLPADLTSDDLILFINKNGVGARVPDANLFDGSLIVGGSILAPAIAVDAITTDHIQANAIQTEHIGSNTIVANHIQGGQVTADKLSVGTVSDNLVVNGSFEDFITGNLVGWEINALTNGTITPVTGKSSSGAVSMELAATTTTANLRFRQLPAQFIPVSSASGRKMYVAARAAASAATTNGFYIRVNWYDANKVLLTSGGTTDIRSNGAITTTFTIYEGQATIPAAARFMGMEILLVNPNVVTLLYVDEVTVHEVTMSAQIGDGQISAVKILANSITADRIQVGSISADRLLVSDRTNYWENPDFEGDVANGIPKGTTNTTTTNSRVIATAGARGSAKCLEFNALTTGNNDAYSTNVFPVEPGDQFYIQYDWKFLNTAGTGQGAVGFRAWNASKVALNQWWSVSTGTTKQTVWQEDDPVAQTYNAKVGEYTVPNGVYFLQPYASFTANGETTNRFHIDNIIIRRMNGGELLVDGAIGAEHIASNTINANHIGANAISAKHIAANAVVAESIAGNAINGKTITGATIQTAVPGAGFRMVLDSTGLNGWDATNTNFLAADEDGVRVTGTLNALGDGFDPTETGEPDLVNMVSPKNIKVTATLGGQAMDSQLLITEQWPQPPSTVPGVGFTPSNRVMNQRSGIKSTDGVNLIMHSGTHSTATQYGFMSMGPHGVNLQALSGSSEIKISGRSGVTVDGMVGPLQLKGTQVLINGANMLPLQHAEFTSTASVPHAILWGPGSMAQDTARSINPSFVNHFQPDCFRVSEAGVYNISIVIDTGTSNVTNTQCIIRRVSDNSLLFGGAKAAGAWEFNVSSSIYLAANEEFRFRYYHEAGGNQNWSARVRITKTSAMSAPASLPGTSHSLTGDLTVGGTAYLKKISNASHWNAEWTAGSVPAATLWGPGQPAPNAALTTDSTLISWPAPDTLQFRDAGIYALSAQVRQNTGVSAGSGSQSFVSFEPMSAGPPAFAKGFMGPNENQCSASIANIKVGAGQQMKCYLALHTAGGGSSTVNWRINVTRVG